MIPICSYRKGLVGLLDRIPQQLAKEASSTAWRESKPASDADAGLQIHNQQVKRWLDHQVENTYKYLKIPTIRRFIPLAPRFTRNCSTHAEKTYEKLEIENQDEIEEKFEIICGLKVEMAGAKSNHGLIASYVGHLLLTAINDGICDVYIGDMYVKPQEDEDDTYIPDISVFSENMKWHYDPDKKITSALNPSLVIEVTSKSTEKQDVISKMQNYLKMSSLKEYIIISSLEVLCFKYTKVEDVWVFTCYKKKSDVIYITSLADGNFQISLRDIYKRTKHPKLEDKLGSLVERDKW